MFNFNNCIAFRTEEDFNSHVETHSEFMTAQGVYIKRNNYELFGRSIKKPERFPAFSMTMVFTMKNVLKPLS